MKLGDSPKATEGKKWETPPAGLHLGILFRIVDAGWCESEFQGEKKMRTEGRFDFELWPMEPNTNKYITMQDGRPFCVAPGFMGWLTFHKMGEILTSWVGKPSIESELILGQPAMLNIQHKGYTKNGETRIAANVIGVLPVPEMIKKSMQLPELANPLMVYSVREHDLDLFNKLPKFIQDHIILKSADWGKVPLHLRPETEKSEKAKTEDDVPF